MGRSSFSSIQEINGEEMETEMVNCSICGKSVPVSETCRTLACRACHKSITFEDCVAGTTPDDLAWKARKEAEISKYECTK